MCVTDPYEIVAFGEQRPELIDEIDFYPGGAPSPYGGYTGGIIDGRTRRARSDERVVDVDANLLQAGGLVREPIRALGMTCAMMCPSHLVR